MQEEVGDDWRMVINHIINGYYKLPHAFEGGINFTCTRDVSLKITPRALASGVILRETSLVQVKLISS